MSGDGGGFFNANSAHRRESVGVEQHLEILLCCSSHRVHRTFDGWWKLKLG